MLTHRVAVSCDPCTAPIDSDMLTLCVAVIFEPCTAPIESDMLTLCVAVTDYTNSRVDTGVRGADGRKISSNPTIEELKRKVKPLPSSRENSSATWTLRMMLLRGSSGHL